MVGMQLRSVAVAVAATVLLMAASAAPPVVAPFDFSRHQIVLGVSVHGTPLNMFVDTGGNPSAIDTDQAKALGFKIDYAGGGEGSGGGDAAHAMVYPTSIDDLVVGGRSFGPIEALAADYAAIRHAYGRPVDGTLGYSFLKGRVTLIDYAAQTLTIADREADLAPQLKACRSVCSARVCNRSRATPFRWLTCGSETRACRSASTPVRTVWWNCSRARWPCRP